MLYQRLPFAFALVALLLPAPRLLAVDSAADSSPLRAELINVQKLADDAPHSAFTDLIYWQNQFICAFRQGRSHVSTDGRIAVLTSLDGEKWSRMATLTLPDLDLRDASLSVTPDGRLMLLGGVSPRKEDHASAPTGSFVAFSDNGREWTKPEVVVEPGRWLWRVTWRDGKAYGVSYAAPKEHPMASLLVSDDGVKFTPLVAKLFGEGYPTEAVIRFAGDGTAYCLQRRDGKPAVNSAYLGVSQAPYEQWKWTDLHEFFGGPNLLQLPTGEWIAAGRIIREGKPTTDIALLDVEQGKLIPLLSLPSGGDTSYPGLVYRDGVLWVSYYSSHEGKTSIYLAQVRLTPK
ncbi:sialidase family protein [Lacipirellula sp.]|uniref:sialidase family protein n=1 Tax=Lacipirellula sp. TaxID=2691419 RepID=UPI003D0F4705